MRKLIFLVVISFNISYGMKDEITTTSPSPHSIMLRAVTEALHNQDEEAQNTNISIKIRKCAWTKKQVTCFVASAGLCATVITAATALTIYFGSCSNS